MQPRTTFSWQSSLGPCSTATSVCNCLCYSIASLTTNPDSFSSMTTAARQPRLLARLLVVDFPSVFEKPLRVLCVNCFCCSIRVRCHFDKGLCLCCFFLLLSKTVQRRRTTTRQCTLALAGSTVFLLTPHVLLLTFAPCVFLWSTKLSRFSFSQLFSFTVFVL